MKRNGRGINGKKAAKDSTPRVDEKQTEEPSDECTLCQDKVCKSTLLEACGHTFCFFCIYKYWASNEDVVQRCPKCSLKLVRDENVIWEKGSPRLEEVPIKARKKKKGMKYNDLLDLANWHPHAEDDYMDPSRKPNDPTKIRVVKSKLDAEAPKKEHLVSSAVNEGYYYCGISRADAEAQLDERGEIGHFLLRDHESIPLDFWISVKREMKNKHFHVIVGQDGTSFTLNATTFTTMDALIEHYTNYFLLVKPLRRCGFKKLDDFLPNM